MEQQLLEYFKDACQKQFGDDLVDIKVSFSASSGICSDCG